MTQPSGKTGLGVGLGVGEEGGLQRACGGGGTSHVEAQSPGGPPRELVLLSAIMRNDGQAGIIGSARRVTWEGEMDFPRCMPLFLNLPLLPADLRESQRFGANGT